MKKLLIVAILAVLASSTGCNFCKRFCPQSAPVYQPVTYAAGSPCTTVVDGCGPCTPVMSAPGQ